MAGHRAGQRQRAALQSLPQSDARVRAVRQASSRSDLSAAIAPRRPRAHSALPRRLRRPRHGGPRRHEAHSANIGAAMDSPRNIRATMILGLGARPRVASIGIHWPSGKVTSTKEVPEGTLLTAFENPADSPTREAFTMAEYRMKPRERRVPVAGLETFALPAADNIAGPDTRLRVYTTLATWCPACKNHLPLLRRLHEEIADEGVEPIAVPIDESDDAAKLADYAREWRLPSRMLALETGRRAEAAAAFSSALGGEAPLPSSVVTDSAGHILAKQSGVPTSPRCGNCCSAPLIRNALHTIFAGR